jgi:hypothetical protein
VLGYVPIHIVNLSLEEIEIEKYKEVGVVSPLQVGEAQVLQRRNVKIVQNGVDAVPGDFEKCAQEKLLHLETRDRLILKPVLYQYEHLFYGIGSRKLGCTNLVEHEIEKGGARPIKWNPYRIPHALKPVVEKHINEMLERKIIEPSISLWSSSIVLVQKKSKDGSMKYRFCVDYRALNVVTKPDVYLIPNILHTLDSLGQSKIFIVLDMASGYHQIPIKPNIGKRPHFRARGHFQFIKMPFGLNNAPATYQRCIDVVLLGLKGIDCLVYLDDIICFSVTMEEHVQKLRTIFNRLEQANFKFNLRSVFWYRYCRTFGTYLHFLRNSA